MTGHNADAIWGIILRWFFDASNGFEEIPEWGGDQVDHGREGCGIAVAPGASACRLEEAVESPVTT